MTGRPARAAGTALAASGTGDVVDAAVVVVGAVARGDAVMTADPDDLRRIAQALGAALRLHAL